MPSVRAKKIAGRFALVILAVCLVLVVQSRLLEFEKQSKPDPSQPAGPAVSADPVPVETPEPTPEVDPLPEVDITSWEFKIANYKQPLNRTFAPDVTETENAQYFDSRAIDALEAFLEGARSAGFEVYLHAGYRPYDTQAYLFFGKASQIAWGTDMTNAEAEELAKQYMAYPGTSDHQTGLGVDILDKAYDSFPEDFGESPLGKWLYEHCAEYGFILRYPEGAKEDTDFDYEPWHFRYVGVDAAKYIMDNQMTLEGFVRAFYS